MHIYQRQPTLDYDSNAAKNENKTTRIKLNVFEVTHVGQCLESLVKHQTWAIHTSPAYVKLITASIHRNSSYGTIPGNVITSRNVA